MKKKGFTLAESLMTLTIIGVIAVVALPGLMADKEITTLQAQLKRTYTELNDFASYFQADHGTPISLWVSQNGVGALQDELKNYFAETHKISDWKYGSNNSERYTTYAHYSNQSVSSPCDATNITSDLSGRTISFDDAPIEGYNGPRICVDINGSKKPNKYGVDIFSFLFTIEGGVIPDGLEHQKNYYDGQGIAWNAGALRGESNCYDHEYGINCAYYALNDINPKDKTKKYWSDYVKKQKYLKSNK